MNTNGLGSSSFDGMMVKGLNYKHQVALPERGEDHIVVTHEGERAILSLPADCSSHGPHSSTSLPMVSAMLVTEPALQHELHSDRRRPSNKTAVSLIVVLLVILVLVGSVGVACSTGRCSGSNDNTGGDRRDDTMTGIADQLSSSSNATLPFDSSGNSLVTTSTGKTLFSMEDEPASGQQPSDIPTIPPSNTILVQQPSHTPTAQPSTGTLRPSQRPAPSMPNPPSLRGEASLVTKHRPTIAPTTKAIPTFHPTTHHVSTTLQPTAQPSAAPTREPTEEPSAAPISEPAKEFITVPAEEPTAEPTAVPTTKPTKEPTNVPTVEPTKETTEEPTYEPTSEPTKQPTSEPTKQPSSEPTKQPTKEPTYEPTGKPTSEPTSEPTKQPTSEPTKQPTSEPTKQPTSEPTKQPTSEPTKQPTKEPTSEPTKQPSVVPTWVPTSSPTLAFKQCSSADQSPGYTLKSWYLDHTNGGSEMWFQCEQLCREDPRCNSWMRRNSGNTCYLSEDKDLKPQVPGCCTDHHPHTLNEHCCEGSTSALCLKPGDDRSKMCSSADQSPGYTLKSWYLDHTNGGSEMWFQCEQLCREDPRCNSWMRRNSGNTCYLSEDKDLKPQVPGCCTDHHPHTFNEGECALFDTSG